MVRKAGINIKIGADLKDFSTKMQNVSRSMKKLGRKFDRLGKKMSRNVTLPLLAMGAAAIKFSSDLEESTNKADVAFGDASKSVKDFAKTTLESFGIAESSSLEMASTFGDMATSMGVTKGLAAEMSNQLVAVAGDMASFKNISIERAQTALDAVFTGETETLKKLGIVMTQTELNAFGMANGFDKTVQQMVGAEKVALRYAFILDRTKNSQGDFARTGGNAANQMRIFQETLKEIAATFGNVILPIFTKALKKLNKMLLSFRDLSPAGKKLRIILLGITAAVGPLLIITGQLSTGMAKGTKAVKYFGNQIIILRAKIAAMSISTLVMATQIALVVAAIALVVGAIVLLIRKKKELLTIQEKEANLREKSIKSVRSEMIVVDTLMGVINDETISKKNRLKAIKELRDVMPSYLKDLTDEEILTGNATKAIDKYRKATIKAAIAKGRQAEIQKRANEIAEKEAELFNLLKAEKKRKAEFAAMSEGKKILSSIGKFYNTTGIRAKGMREEIALLNGELKEFVTEFGGSGLDDAPDNIVTPTGDSKPANRGTEGAVGGLVSKGIEEFSPFAKRVEELRIEIKKLEAETNKYNGTMTEFVSNLVKANTAAEATTNAIAKLLTKILNTKEGVKDAAKSIKGIIEGALTDSFVLLGETIGRTLAGADEGFDNFGQNLAKIALGMVKSIGKVIIALGALLLVAAIFTGGATLGPGLAAIGIGTALTGAAAFGQFKVNESQFSTSRVRGEDIYLSGSRYASSKGRVR
jgi:hypothetical protein